jgi:hypothetical protein
MTAGIPSDLPMHVANVIVLHQPMTAASKKPMHQES